MYFFYVIPTAGVSQIAQNSEIKKKNGISAHQNNLIISLQIFVT